MDMGQSVAEQVCFRFHRRCVVSKLKDSKAIRKENWGHISYFLPSVKFRERLMKCRVNFRVRSRPNP